jgi:ribosomal protein S18 acetylase RimI-like enzyme
MLNLRIRKAQPQDAPAIAKVHVESWRTTYAGIIASEFLAALSVEERERMWLEALSASPASVSLYVAETAEGEMVGFAAAGPEREGDTIYRGEVYAIYLLKNYHRQGIGSALFRACVQDLESRGFTSFLLWVLKANPACQFYQALGGKFLREKEAQFGSQQLIGIAYGWADTRNVVNAESKVG